MSARVDRLVSDVVATPEAEPAGEEMEESRWTRAEELRAELRRFRERQTRTRAGGFDD